MSTLTIRDLDARVSAHLRERAARAGRSVEDEAHRILSETLVPVAKSEPDLAEAIRRRFAPLGGIELETHPPVNIADPLRFDR